MNRLESIHIRSTGYFVELGQKRTALMRRMKSFDRQRGSKKHRRKASVWKPADLSACAARPWIWLFAFCAAPLAISASALSSFLPVWRCAQLSPEHPGNSLGSDRATGQRLATVEKQTVLDSRFRMNMINLVYFDVFILNFFYCEK